MNRIFTPRFAGTAIAALIFALLLALSLASAFLPPRGIPSEGLVFKVEKGEGASLLASRLESEGIVRSATAFVIAARLSRKGSSLKAGTYRLEPGMGAFSLMQVIASGREYAVRITIPEGFTIRMMATLFGDQKIVDSDAFIAAAHDPELTSSLGIPAPTAEGYLFPDTYWFPPDSDAREVVSRMIAAFREKVGNVSTGKARTPKELHEAVILASVIEREYRIEEEAPRMASVFYNRLKIGMRLQSCATIVYILTERQGKLHPDTVTAKDLAIRDPYNTYLHAGLPPGPIANPGLAALRAVFFPAETPYFYFRLSDPVTGRHRFSRSLDEHNDTGTFIVKKPGK